jgi:hypothetical protein
MQCLGIGALALQSYTRCKKPTMPDLSHLRVSKAQLSTGLGGPSESPSMQKSHGKAQYGRLSHLRVSLYAKAHHGTPA